MIQRKADKWGIEPQKVRLLIDMGIYKTQREIKFRGKRIDNGDWVYGSYTQMREDDHNECFRAKPHKVYHRIWQWKAGDWNMGGYANYEVIPETVGQFTGLKDKNGVEIYEGDIFHLGDKNITYTVVWYDTGLRGQENGTLNYVGLEHWKGLIVKVGTIYDNPEMLEL